MAEAKTLLHAPTFSTRNIQKFRYLHLRDRTLHQSNHFAVRTASINENL